MRKSKVIIKLYLFKFQKKDKKYYNKVTMLAAGIVSFELSSAAICDTGREKRCDDDAENK